MNSITYEALKRIQEQEYYLEVHGLLEPLVNEMDSCVTRDYFEQIKLFEEKSK